MRKLLLTAAAMFCALAYGQVPVVPNQQPHVTFVNAQGLPCSGCKLYTYAAGTTTALATYTDATGTTQNTNPVVLDIAGGANIWYARNSYKLTLKDPLGNTIWTVDSVNASSLFPCGPANSVQFANGTVTGLDCDAQIFVDKINHTFNVGTMTPNHVVIGALGVPTTWFFDTTTPATALASLGGGLIGTGTVNQLAYYATAGNSVSGTSAIPNGITATTQAVNDNSTKVATTAYVKTPGAINPTSLTLATGVAMTDNQGNGEKIQHSTGAASAGDCASFDTNGNVIDSGQSCSAITAKDYYFSFTGCTLAVSGNSTDCRASANFNAVTPVVPVQPDTNYYIGCTTYTTQDWGSSTGVNNVSTTGFSYVENVDRYNGASATVTPTVWCHLHHN